MRHAGILGGRRVHLLVVARLLPLLADTLSTFAIPVVVYTRTGSTVLSGTAYTLQWVPRVICLPVIGVVVDKLDRRRQLVWSDGLRALLVLLAAVTHLSLVPLIVIAGALMLLDSHGTIATESVLSTHVEPSRIGAAQGGLQLDTQLARTAGPAAGGVLLATVGASWAFFVTAVLFAAGALATLLVLPPGGPPTAPARIVGITTELREGLSFIKGHARLRGLLLLAVVVNLVSGTVLAVLPPLMLGQFHETEQRLGLVLAVASATSIAAATWVTAAARRARRNLIVGVFVSMLSAGALLLAVAHDALTFAVSLALWSSGITVFSVWLRERRLRLIPPDLVGRTLGFFVAAMLAAVPIGGSMLVAFGSLASPQLIVRGMEVATLAALVWLGRWASRSLWVPERGDTS